MSDSIKGRQIHPRYELLSLLGEGGTSQTFKAIDRIRNQTIVIKQSLEPRFDELILSEFEILRHLDHPNIPSVFDYYLNEDKGGFFSMEFIEGEGLDAYLDRGLPLEQRFFVSLFFQLLSLLHYIHKHQLIHRDIKPANIILSAPVAPTEPGWSPTIRLIDFGLAASSGSEEGHLYGTVPVHISRDPAQRSLWIQQ